MSDIPKIFALFGDTLAHPLYAATLNAAFAAAGVKWPYVPFRANPETLPVLFTLLRRDGLAGANFVSPCEEAAAALCDTLSPEADALGAVDTLRCAPNAVEGFKLDVYAFTRFLDELGITVADEKILVLGVGPSGRACGLALERAGAAVTYAASDVTQPRPGISTRATVFRMDDVPQFLTTKKPALVVNASPNAGVRELPPSVTDALPPGASILDVSCRSRTNRLDAAGARGFRYFDGLPMLLYKLARAFEIWTGLEAPPAVMRRAAAAELARREP
jgi:shikimate dehydrogenase